MKEAPGEIKVFLVGDKEASYRQSPDLGDYAESASVVHASEVIDMSASPVEALRQKKDSSLAVTGYMLKKREVNAIFSAGNTGAHMASSLFSAGKIEGVSRPTIGSFYPTPNGTGFLLDVGASTDCKPHHLLQFGIMGSIFVKHFLQIDNPRIGLLSIGEEPSKGNAVTVEAHKLYKNSSLNFAGNVEGRDVFSGSVDIVVCDGFIGNILLKLFETYATTMVSGLHRYIGDSILEQLGYSLLERALNNYKEDYNYENYGGVPLLGINGVSIIGHGSSSPLAVKSAIFSAKRIYENDIPGKIKKALVEY